MNSLRSNSTGGYNTAIGTNALLSNATGVNNSAFGVAALLSGTANSGNNVFGSNGGRYLSNCINNVVVGYLAGLGIIGGTSYAQSVLVGAYAGQALTTSQVSNVLIGYKAGGALSAGSGNIVIGTSLSPYPNTGSNQLNLGNVLFGDLGNGSSLQGKLGINVTSPTAALEVSGSVGIGTASPSSTLHLVGSNTVSGGLTIGANTGSAQRGALYPGGSGSLNLQTLVTNGNFQIHNSSGTIIFRLGTQAGVPQLLLGESNTNPSATLQVSGSIRMGMDVNTSGFLCDANRAGTVHYNGSAFQVCYGSGGWTNLADVSSTLAANDNIVSGSAYVKAVQDTGALVSGSLSVSGTLQLANGPADTCSTTNGGALKHVGNRFYFCRP